MTQILHWLLVEVSIHSPLCMLVHKSHVMKSFSYKDFDYFPTGFDLLIIAM